MGQLEDLQMNRIIRAQQIQKGFCCGDTEGDIFKAHNVGDVHPNHPDWVWTQLPNGKYDWRVRKGQAKPAPAPAPKPSGEPDFTPKIPSAIARLTNRSDANDFDNAYRTLGAEIFKEKFPTAADFQKWLDDNQFRNIKTQQAMELYLGRKEAGVVYHPGVKPLSKTNQIFAMKEYYKNKAEDEKKAYQEKKNSDYWAGDGAKRRTEISKRLRELSNTIAKNMDDATQAIKSLVATSVSDGHSNTKTIPVDVSFDVNRNNERITIQEMTNTGSRFNDGMEITITHGGYMVKPGDKEYDTVGTAEINMSSMRTKQSDSADWEHECNKIMLANTTVKQIDKIKEEIMKYASVIRKAEKEREKLNEELDANH